MLASTLMVPYPWALHALHFLADHPDNPFGVHLTAISDWADYRWGPLTPREKVPTREYGLALRVAGRASIEKVQSQGLPSNDHDFLDSYLFDPVDTSATFEQLLRELPAGLSEWAVHPGLDNSELLAIEADSQHIRQRDYGLVSSQESAQ